MKNETLKSPKEGKAKSTQFQFATPAKQVDFPNDPAKQKALNTQWNNNLNGFTQQGITGNPWNSANAASITNYFNPINTPIPSDAIVAPITWNAFPGRIGFYFPQLSMEDILSLADTGYMNDGKTSFPNITQDPCSGQPINKAYGPYGPRGWQDEYCEWAVTRNASKNITRIDFTCENPEYWNSLWMIDPQAVVKIYQTTLSKPQIKLEDLYLLDAKGKPVTDPSTGRPAYNPLNKWNSGPFSTDTAGGAMHLTSTPNTLQTEIGLATAATMQRVTGNSDFNKLICCAQYGQPHRNSDPNIGGTVNQIIGGGLSATLTNPPGLYIQNPDFSLYETPDGTPASAFWKVVRGQQTMNNENGNQLPGNFILHAVFEVPASYGYTVSDIKIKDKNGNAHPILYAGQVSQSFNMQIVATAFNTQTPPTMACVCDPQTTYAQPEQLFHQPVFEAMATTNVANPVLFPMTLISNSTLIAPLAEQNTSDLTLVLTCATTIADPKNPSAWPIVTFDGNGDVTAKVTSVSQIEYAVPGNSYPSPSTVLYLSVNIAPGAQIGLRDLYLTNQGQPKSTAMPALLNVVPAGTILKN